MTDAQREELLTLAKLVQFNVPNAKRPDDFHIVKSDIVSRLRRMAREEGT